MRASQGESERDRLQYETCLTFLTMQKKEYWPSSLHHSSVLSLLFQVAAPQTAISASIVSTYLATAVSTSCVSVASSESASIL